MQAKQKTSAERHIKQRGRLGLHPWRCERRGEHCEIVAYADASGAWETIAVIPSTSGASADFLAGFIVNLVNESQEDSDVLEAARKALEAVMEEGLTFSTEQEAEHVIDRLKHTRSLPTWHLDRQGSA